MIPRVHYVQIRNYKSLADVDVRLSPLTVLDFKALHDRQIRAVTMEDGRSLIAPVDPLTRDAIRERFYTPGELLHNGELRGDLAAAREAARNLNLFGPPLGMSNEEDDEENDRPHR